MSFSTTRGAQWWVFVLTVLLSVFGAVDVAADSVQSHGLKMGLKTGLKSGVKIGLKPVFTSVTLSRPLALIELPSETVVSAGETNDTTRIWYVLEQAGRVLRLEQSDTTLKSTVFVDIRDRVESGPNEAGLLGMAIDPAFSRNTQLYLSYTRKGSPLVSVLSRFVSADGGQTLDSESEQVLLEVEQPFSNHNGGDIHFGPDGHLYYGLGDGGAAGDPQGNGQNTKTLLGSLLRLNVDSLGPKSTYHIPQNNPFAKKDDRAEIFAYGLRNPWRWSFDRKTGDLWLADVGQNTWEEINIVKRGGNYGWNLREGAHCYSGDCRAPELIEPVAEYSHDDGCSVTGGYVYRGDAISDLQGIYLFGDFCSGKIWGLFPASDGRYQRQLLIESGLNIASFAEDKTGEVYVLDLKGEIFQIIPGQ